MEKASSWATLNRRRLPFFHIYLLGAFLARDSLFTPAHVVLDGQTMGSLRNRGVQQLHRFPPTQTDGFGERNLLTIEVELNNLDGIGKEGIEIIVEGNG